MQCLIHKYIQLPGFLKSSCIIHLCRTVDIPVGKVGPNQWAVSGRDRLRREGRVIQQKTEAESAVESLLWPVWRKSVFELWGHSERTVRRKWRRNWRRWSPSQEQKEADIKNHLLHGKFVLFLLFLKLNKSPVKSICFRFVAVCKLDNPLSTQSSVTSRLAVLAGGGSWVFSDNAAEGAVVQWV